MRQWDLRDVELPQARRLRIRTWPGRGRPLVLLHGFLDDSEGWAELARDTHRPCFAIDLPGFGGSSCPTEPRISAYATDVLAGLDSLGVDTCTLVGHSLGGAVAVAVAERSPAVHSLALLAPGGFGAFSFAEAVAMPGVLELAELAVPFALISPVTITAAYATFIAHHRLPSTDYVVRLAHSAFTCGPGVRAAIVAVAASGRSSRAFHRREIAFSGPVAVLWGEHDAIVPLDHIRALKRSLPQAHVEVWDGMGHHPQRERPVELARFIEQHASRGQLRPAA